MLKLRNAFFALIPLAMFACQEPADREIQVAVQGFSTQLAAAIEQRELAKTDLRELQVLDAPTELLDRLARESRAAKGEAPSGPSSGPGVSPAGPRGPSLEPGGTPTERKAPGPETPAKEKAKPWPQPQTPDELLTDLVRLREELALRGAVNSHRASAEVAWEVETLRQLSIKLTFPPDFPPANEFRLLAPKTLDKLIERWTDKQRYLERFAAAVPFANLKPALEECAAKLKALREARVAPQVQAPLFPRPRDSLEDTKAWIAQRNAGRAEAIQRVEVQYLERALAAVPDDIAAAMRLAELKAAPSEAAHLAWRRQARDLAYALSPRPAPPAAQAEDLLRNLISDPLTAAQNEAALDLVWSELRTIEPQSQVDALLPRRLRGDREGWIVSLLSERELLQADTLFSEGLSRLHIVSAKGLEFLRPSTLPQERITRYAESVKREIAVRKSGGVTPATAAVLRQLALPASVERLTTAQISEILSSPEGKRREWEALQRYKAAGVSGSELDRRLASLTLAGLQEQVGSFEREATSFRHFRSEITQNGLPLLPQEAASALADARESLWGKGWRIRRGLDQLNGQSVKEVADLKRRMDEAILLCGLRWGGADQPPPVSSPPRRPPPGGPATAYADPDLLAATQSFEKSMQKLESLAPIPERPENGRPTYAFEKDQSLRVRLAANGQRPEPKGWRVNEEVISYDQIDGLRTIQGLPGGVALGRRADVAGDFHKYGLIYDAADRRLKLVSLAEVIVLPEVPPAALKAYFLFARDKDPVAVSIGYTGDEDKLFGRNARRVSIHPVLRDTQVGLDVIEADRLPWSLESETLPNGRRNPFVTQMRPAIDQIRKETKAALPIQRLLDKVGEKGYSLAPALRNSWVPAILALSATSSVSDLMIRAVAKSEEPEERFEQYSTLEDYELLEQIDKALPNDSQSDMERMYRELQRQRDARDPLKEWRERQRQRQEPSDVFGLSPDNGRDPFDVMTGRRRDLRLPDEMERTLKRYEFLKKLRAAPETVERRQKVGNALASLPSKKEDALLSLCLGSFAREENPSWNEAVRLALALAAASTGSKALSAEEIAEQTLLLVQAKQLSLLTDAKVRWERAGGDLRDDSALRVRYVRGEVRATDKGLSRPDVAAEHPAAGQAATKLLPSLEAIYPALARTRKAAAWIALMRWALEPGNVAWLDLADLATTDHRTVQTPDYFCDDKRGQPCLEEIGNTGP